MSVRSFVAFLLVALLAAGCSTRTERIAAADDQARHRAREAEGDAKRARCIAQADRRPEAWSVTYWMCLRDEDRVISLKYRRPDPDLDAFYYTYVIAVARRKDAGLLTPDEATAAYRRVLDAVKAEEDRRTAQEQAQLDANRRAASLSALAIGLGAIVRNQPPPPETTFYNFGGTPITCTRWQNVVNCF